MIHSMTGFGRGVAERDSSRMTVELKSVNSRYLETNVKMPRVILALENDVKNLIAQSVARGKMDVYINYEPGEGQKTVTVSEDLGAYVAALREASERYGLPDDLGISHVLRIPDMLQTRQKDTDPEDVWPLLEEAVQAALEQFNDMREREGMRIREDLLGKASEIERIVQSLQQSAPEIEDAYREKLTRRIQEILSRNSGIAVDRGLLENEIVFYADHCCIDEEMVRLTSHIAQLRQLLGSEEPVGRQLDFLLQEFNREANTIASKAGSLSVTQEALNLKKEIEKVREQIQNLE
ncbi:MAG: YicC family protein [Firmicutes bacterium]|nr:YicC family protein [Bacillota bacterium]